MLFLKYLLMLCGIGVFLLAAGTLVYETYRAWKERQRQEALPPEAKTSGSQAEPWAIPWTSTARLLAVAWIPVLLSLAIVVIPSGEGGVRVSQTSGTRPGTLYPGSHLVRPLLDQVVTYDIKDQVLTTSATPREVEKEAKGEKPSKQEALVVQAKEGLPIGLAITVRYRFDPRRLDYIHSHLPQPVQTELVPPVVASAFRDLAPRYTVREIFATRREEFRQKATDVITKKLCDDGIEVKEVMLRDIQLPPEYAKGLETLLLKEQEDDRMVVEADIQQKQVRIAELQGEAEKATQVKQAEAQAQVRVLQAKGESDAMQYTLPLKEKQIQQSRLEAEARKEATIKGAEAAAAAKVIDSKAEQERRGLLASAEANRIRVTASADAERLREEAAVLKQNPLLINKIMAERLSDKLQIMMVPADGKFFFNDLFKGMSQNAVQSEDSEDTPRQPAQGGSR